MGVELEIITFTNWNWAGLEGGAVFFDLDHQVVNVDQFSTDWQRLEWWLREYLLETVVELDELGQSTLCGCGWCGVGGCGVGWEGVVWVCA